MGDIIILDGLSLSGLKSYSYVGNSTGGVLSLHEPSGTTNLNIIGDFNAGSFNFSAGPQFLTTSPPSLEITVGGTLHLANDTGPSSSDNITSDPTVTENGYPNAFVSLVIDGTPLATTLQADASGIWSYSPQALSDGTHTIVASEFAAGVHASTVALGTAALTFTLDTSLTAHGDAYVTIAGQPLSVGVADGVLANDTSQSPITASLTIGPAHGSVQFSADGSFIYNPAPGFSGVDTFSNQASNGINTADATASVYVVPVSLGPTTTLSLLTLTAEEQIAATYTAFFSRGADSTGFQFWVNLFNQFHDSRVPDQLFSDIANSFGVSAEAQGLYPFLANPQGASDAQISSFLNSVYENLFNRDGDAAGLTYWTGQIRQVMAQGQFVGSVLVNIIGGAQNTPDGQDITTLMTQVAVALEYVHQQEQLGTPWSFASDGASATNLLHAVTSDPATVLTGIKQADLLVQADVH
jgi:hypothetical protein